MFPFSSLVFAIGMMGGLQAPKGSILHIRLTSPVGSFASRPGARVEAALIAPIAAPGGAVVFPAGSKLRGEVKSVRRVGLGLVHETASLELEFRSIAGPDGQDYPVSARLIGVDNGREEVTAAGTIREVRTTASVGNRAAHYIRDALLMETHAQVAVWAVNSLVTQLPEPEIFLPAGAELTLRLNAPLPAEPAAIAPGTLAAHGPRSFTAQERASLQPILATAPDRTQASSGRSSDIVNLAIIGSQSELATALRAAGWIEARPFSIRSRLSTVSAVVRGRGAPDAPMAGLLLNDVPADMSWEKSLNDFAKRHHVRLWKLGETADGQEVWTGAATHDIDYAFFRPGGGLITHAIARQVDHERDKVVEDLAFTSCVDAADLWERPHAPRVLKNDTGNMMETDGRLAVMRLNRCENPAGPVVSADTLPMHGGAWELILRRQILNFRSDVIRQNWIWRGYEGLRYLIAACEHKPAKEPDTAPVETRTSKLQPDWLTTIVSLR
ncbi:MAG TPA: LssY C-terminal domain-containing protein [Bryobacteraceae bacterium]|nr:LssY C-terminal domain-containing protein [Bryobacteraceae bacterium]